MTIVLRRLAVSTVVFLAWAPAAHAWSWPVKGPVLQPFVYDEAHPYAAGQHRGIDIGADGAGQPVVAPATGTVSFAGTVPTSGKAVTLQTADGYSVTLTHLGSVIVVKGAAVAEGDSVGSVGPSGTPEVDGPYVHLGIRVTSDPGGYLDPLSFLPPPATSGPPEGDTTASQPTASGGTSGAATDRPAAVVPPSGPASSTRTQVGQKSLTPAPLNQRGRTGQSRSSREAPGQQSSPRSASRLVGAGNRVGHRLRTQHLRRPELASSSRRQPVEAAPARPTGLEAGDEIRSTARIARELEPQGQPQTSSRLLPTALNGLAALIALAAALATGMGRSRRAATRQVAGAQVLGLPAPGIDLRRERHAA